MDKITLMVRTMIERRKTQGGQITLLAVCWSPQAMLILEKSLYSALTARPTFWRVSLFSSSSKRLISMVCDTAREMTMAAVSAKTVTIIPLLRSDIFSIHSQQRPGTGCTSSLHRPTHWSALQSQFDRVTEDSTGRRHDRCTDKVPGAPDMVPKPMTVSLQQKVHIRVSMQGCRLSRYSPLQSRYTYRTINPSYVNLRFQSGYLTHSERRTPRSPSRLWSGPERAARTSSELMPP